MRRKRGIQFSTWDVILAGILLLMLFSLFQFQTKGKEAAQDAATLAAAKEAQSSVALNTLLRMPYESGTIGDHIVSTILGSSEVLVTDAEEEGYPFPTDVQKLIHEFLDPQFDSLTRSWELRIVYEKASNGIIAKGTDAKQGVVTKYARIRGTSAQNNPKVCNEETFRGGSVTLPILTEENLEYKIVLLRCGA